MAVQLPPTAKAGDRCSAKLPSGKTIKFTAPPNAVPGMTIQVSERYWTPKEDRLFMEAVNIYGWKDMKSIAKHVGTRTQRQVITHKQKVLLRQQKELAGTSGERA